MIIRRPVNKPRWFGLSGIGGGDTPPSQDIPIITGAGFGPSYPGGVSDTDFDPSSLGEGVYYISPSTKFKEGHYNPEATELMDFRRPIVRLTAQRIYEPRKTGYAFGETPAEWVSPVPIIGGSKKLSKNQYYVSLAVTTCIPHSSLGYNEYENSVVALGPNFPEEISPNLALSKGAPLFDYRDTLPDDFLYRIRVREDSSLVEAYTNIKSAHSYMDEFVRKNLFPTFEANDLLHYANFNLDFNMEHSSLVVSGESPVAGPSTMYRRYFVPKIEFRNGFSLEHVKYVNVNHGQGYETSLSSAYRIMYDNRPATIHEVKNMLKGGNTDMCYWAIVIFGGGR